MTDLERRELLKDMVRLCGSHEEVENKIEEVFGLSFEEIPEPICNIPTYIKDLCVHTLLGVFDTLYYVKERHVVQDYGPEVYKNPTLAALAKASAKPGTVITSKKICVYSRDCVVSESDLIRYVYAVGCEWYKNNHEFGKQFENLWLWLTTGNIDAYYELDDYYYYVIEMFEEIDEDENSDNEQDEEADEDENSEQTSASESSGEAYMDKEMANKFVGTRQELVDELTYLETVKEKEIRQKIKEAKDACTNVDENEKYNAANEELRKLDHRIDVLNRILLAWED